VDEKYTLLKLSVALPLRLSKSDSGKLLVECAFDEPFWTKPAPRVISIDTEPPVTNQDIGGLQIDESGEKTGEEPADE
jgi:hypothetical protein